MQLVFCFALPIAIPYYVFGETFYYSFVASIARYVIVLNATWSVNSFAHLYGNKPYDKYVFWLRDIKHSLYFWLNVNNDVTWHSIFYQAVLRYNLNFLQKYSTSRKQIRLHSRPRWRLAQLPSHFPMGLQNVRIWIAL